MLTIGQERRTKAMVKNSFFNQLPRRRAEGRDENERTWSRSYFDGWTSATTGTWRCTTWKASWHTAGHTTGHAAGTRATVQLRHDGRADLLDFFELVLEFFLLGELNIDEHE